MRTLRISFILFAACFMVASLQAQSWKSDEGPGYKQTRSVGDFDKVSVSGGIDLYLRQGSSKEVVVKASDHVIDRVMTEVNGSVLKIYMKKGRYRNAKMEVYVTVDELEELHASGGSDVYGKGTFKADEFAIHASGGCDVEMELEVAKLEVHASGGSDTDLDGSAEELMLYASGGSDFEGYDFKTSHAVVRASGGSDSNVFATESIEVYASGSSDVNYKGGPAKTKIKSSGSSDVHSH